MDKNGEINPYHEIIPNEVEKDDTIILQMEQWSVISSVVNNIQYGRYLKKFYDLDIKAVDQKSHEKIYNKEDERQMFKLDFGDIPEKLREDYN